MALTHKYNEEWGDDQRMNIIGQNGNTGEHYDTVNSPSHYTQGDIECIDAIAAALNPDEFRGYLKGNILKYTWRERQKDGETSMRKAQWYINRLLDKTR